MKKSKPQKPYWEMTVSELAEATKEFDKPIPASRMRPMTRAQRAEFERARSGGVISIHTRPKRKVQVTVKLDEATLHRCESYADRHHLSLSDVVNLGLRTAFQFAD